LETLFIIASAVAVLSTAMVITRAEAVHALLYLIVSLLSVALVFFLLGAPFAAALEVIIYAGAIMVFFVFVIMMLNLGPRQAEEERKLLEPGLWVGPAALALVLAGELLFIVLGGASPGRGAREVAPREVGAALFGPYAIAVELASMLLLAGLVGAFHLGRKEGTPEEKEERG